MNDAPHAASAILQHVDHLVYAVPSLDAAVAELEARLGVRAAAGGRHPQWGTHNALIALGPASYLEIIAPEPGRRGPGPQIFGLAEVSRPRLATWAAREPDLDGIVARAAAAGIRLGAIRAGSRTRPDGTQLTWRLTDSAVAVADGLVPFFIDWGTAQHPAASAPGGATLEALRGEHPEPERVRAMLAALGLPLAIDTGPSPVLLATIATPAGHVELR
jgi:Glyoxalase-like domain